jgi:hypothetical protein
MAKVMEFFIYQNFRGNFYPEIQKMFRNLANRSQKAKKKALLGLSLELIKLKIG